MLNKLLKYDLKRNFSWLWILSAITLAVSGLTRLIGIGSGTLVEVIKGIFSGITAALIANVLIQPFIRFFITFQKDVFGDESYLTHTLPVTKDHILFSRFISALIQLIFAIIVTVLSIFILYWTPELGLKLIDLINFALQNSVSGASFTAGQFIVLLAFDLFFAIILMTVTGYTSVIVANRCQNKKTLIAVILAIVLMYFQNLIIGLISLGIAAIFGAELLAETLTSSAFIALFVSYLILEVVLTVVHILVSRHIFNKGVNVD